MPATQKCAYYWYARAGVCVREQPVQPLMQPQPPSNQRGAQTHTRVHAMDMHHSDAHANAALPLLLGVGGRQTCSLRLQD